MHLRVRARSARRLVGQTSARLALGVLLVSLAAAVAPGAVAGSSPAAPGAPAAHPTQAVCGPAAPGYASCLSLRRTDVPARARSFITPSTAPPGYGPTDLQSAYALPGSTAGAGETVAVVDAYDQPTAETDLATYRTQYGLSACTTANGCFRKVNQTGGTSYPAANSGWGVEIDLDIEMVSAICSNCHILLVEANSNSLGDLGTAVNEAVALGAVAVSNSYGGGEFSGESGYDSVYYNHPGVAITASSGDEGYGVAYPAASPDVVAVGGTTLSRATNTRGWSETAWSGAGSGCSAYESKPSWQKDTGCVKRTVADVSAVADPNTGVAVYDTYGYGGWIEVGGTSVASPIIASTYALAGTPLNGTYPGSYPYANPGALNDVTSGSNGSCRGLYLCTAGLGYDGPTGLGTPNGTAAFSRPGSANDFSISASPSSLTIAQGGSSTSTIGTAVASGSAQAATLTASVSPTGPTASLSPASVTVGGSSTLTVTVGSSVAAGTYTVAVTGTEGAAIHSTTVAVTVTGSANDFSISASPSSLTIAQGGSSTSTIGTAVASGSAQAATLTASVSPTGPTASLSPASVTVGGSSTLTVTVGSSVAAGTYTVAVTGTEGAAIHSTTVAVTVTGSANDFSISASPSSLTIAQGGSSTSTIGTAVASGSAQAATLTASVSPTGPTASLSPASVTVGGSSTLTVTVGSSVAAGTYTVAVTGTEGAAIHSTTVAVTVTGSANDFSISASPSSLTIAQGGSSTSTIGTAVASGSAQAATLTASVSPTGPTASLSPASVTVGGSSTLTVTVGSSVAAGTYTVAVTGTEGAAIHSTTVAVTVTGAGLPGAPELTATTAHRGVEVDWTVPANNGSAISAYRIYRATTSGDEVFLVQLSSRSTSYSDTKTVSGTVYFYRITAVNGNGEGPFSGEASARAA